MNNRPFHQPGDPPRARAVRKCWRIDPGPYLSERDPHAFGERCDVPAIRNGSTLVTRCPHLGLGLRRTVRREQ